MADTSGGPGLQRADLTPGRRPPASSAGGRLEGHEATHICSPFHTGSPVASRAKSRPLSLAGRGEV